MCFLAVSFEFLRFERVRGPVRGAGAREETLLTWYDIPVEFSDAFDTFLTEPGLDPAHHVFGLNAHTDPEYTFCGTFALRKEGETDPFGAYGSEVVFRTPETAEDCRGDGLS